MLFLTPNSAIVTMKHNMKDNGNSNNSSPELVKLYIQRKIAVSRGLSFLLVGANLTSMYFLIDFVETKPEYDEIEYVYVFCNCFFAVLFLICGIKLSNNEILAKQKWLNIPCFFPYISLMGTLLWLEFIYNAVNVNRYRKQGYEAFAIKNKGYRKWLSKRQKKLIKKSMPKGSSSELAKLYIQGKIVVSRGHSLFVGVINCICAIFSFFLIIFGYRPTHVIVFFACSCFFAFLFLLCGAKLLKSKTPIEQKWLDIPSFFPVVSFIGISVWLDFIKQPRIGMFIWLEAMLVGVCIWLEFIYNAVNVNRYRKQGYEAFAIKNKGYRKWLSKRQK